MSRVTVLEKEHFFGFLIRNLFGRKFWEKLDSMDL